MEAWAVWVLTAIVLFTLEVFVPGFFLACLGVGSLIAGVLSMLNVGLTIQFFAFALVTLVVFIKIRPFFLKFLYRDDKGVRTNTEALIGKQGVVIEEIFSPTFQGRVKVGGEDWPAEAADGQRKVVGELILVERVEGNKVFVKRIIQKGEEG